MEPSPSPSWYSNTTTTTETTRNNTNHNYRSAHGGERSHQRQSGKAELSGDALVGNDLLDHVTRGYSELSIGTQSTTPVSSHGSGSHQLRSSYTKRDSPTNLSLGGVLFNNEGGIPPSPSPHEPDIWGGGVHMERSTSVGGDTSSSMFHSGGSYHHQHSPLVRSQSAAPLLGPPPGMRAMSTPSWEQQFPRSVSVGSTMHNNSGMEEPTVRPAAKTLMELIQEDVPPSSASPGGHMGYNSSITDELSSSQRTRRSPLQWQHQQPGNSGASQQMQQQEYYSHHQQQQPHQLQHIQMQRQGGPPPQQQHHVVYNNNGMQHREIPGTVRVQTVPGGNQQQQVYINAGPPQQQQQQQGGYSFAPVPFQSCGQQQQHTQQQYVSVVSMPGGGQQVSYWPPTNAVQTHQQDAYLDTSPVGSPMGATHHQHYRREKSVGGRGGRRPRGRADSKGSTATSATSALLDEFRASKSRDWTIRRIEGHISEFCQDQNGSRFIQQRLEMGDIMEQQIVMKEVLPAIRILRTDVFGNYVVQKLLDFGTPKMKQQIKATLEGEMLQLSLQMYGCRVVQKAIETLDEDDLPRLLREFHHNVLNCIHDQNGNHVIQKCVEVLYTRARKALELGDTHRSSFLNEQVDFVIEDVLVNTTSLSCHPYGCRVLQRMLEHCPHKRKMQVLDEIKMCHKTLLDDQYGNYVIQHVLQYGRDEDRDSLLHIIAQSGLLRLSRQKFASNVVEKLLKYGNGNQRRGIVREMLKITEDSAMYASQPHRRVSVVLLMVRDAYANYVVQTTLDVVPESEERRLLLKELNAHVEELRNYTFAKHIVVKLAALTNEQQQQRS